MDIVQSVEQAARCGELELEEQADKELSETIIKELRDEYPNASEEGLRKTAELELKRRKDIEALAANIKALQQPKNLKELKQMRKVFEIIKVIFFVLFLGYDERKFNL